MSEQPLLLLVVSTSRGEAEAYVSAAQQAGARVACIARENVVPSTTEIPLPTPRLSVEEAVTVVDEWGQTPTGVLGVGLMGGVVAAHLNVHFGLDGHTPGGIGITANRERLLRRLGSADLELPEFRVVKEPDWDAGVLFEIQPPFVMTPAIRRDVESRIGVVTREEAQNLLEDPATTLARLGSPPGVVVEETQRKGKTGRNRNHPPGHFIPWPLWNESVNWKMQIAWIPGFARLRSLTVCWSGCAGWLPAHARRSVWMMDQFKPSSASMKKKRFSPMWWVILHPYPWAERSASERDTPWKRSSYDTRCGLKPVWMWMQRPEVWCG